MSDHFGPNVNQELEKVYAESRQNRSLFDGVFVCEKCGKTFSSKEILLEHLSNHIESKTRTKESVHVSKPAFECDLCLLGNWRKINDHRYGEMILCYNCLLEMKERRREYFR